MRLRPGTVVRHLPVFVAVAAVIGVGLALWIRSDSGGKADSLGSALLGGAVVGVVLLFAEIRFERLARERETLRALGASAEPTAGQVDEATPADVAPVTTHDPAGRTHRYEVIYQGKNRDTSRIDAYQIRLVVKQEDRYFQFVSAIADGPSVLLLGAEKVAGRGRFWWMFCQAAGPMIEDATQRGEIPLAEPRHAYEVRPDVEEVVERMHRLPAQERRRIPEVSEGDVVFTFTA